MYFSNILEVIKFIGFPDNKAFKNLQIQYEAFLITIKPCLLLCENVSKDLTLSEYLCCIFKMCTSFLKRLSFAQQFSCSTEKSLGIIGVPFSKGQGKNGVENTPKIMREAGLINILQGRLKVKDYGDLQYKEAEFDHAYYNMKNYNDFIGCSTALIQKVKHILNEHDMYLAIGGDHAIGFGSVAGHLLANENISLIWIDAHPDINLNTTSKSGNIHGMPVALLLKELRKFWDNPTIENIAPNCLPVKELIYIGLRDIDTKEAYMLNKLGITYYAMDSIDRYGIAKIVEMCLDSLSFKNKLHISFDIDSLDVNFAPSTGTAVSGGLTLRESLYIMETMCETGRVQALDIVEINPQIGTKTDTKKTLSSGMDIIKSCFGYRRSGNFCSTNSYVDL